MVIEDHVLVEVVPSLVSLQVNMTPVFLLLLEDSRSFSEDNEGLQMSSFVYEHEDFVCWNFGTGLDTRVG